MLQGEKIYNVRPRDAAKIVGRGGSTGSLSEMVRRGELTSKVVDIPGRIGKMNLYCMVELVALRAKIDAKKAEIAERVRAAEERRKLRKEHPVFNGGSLNLNIRPEPQDYYYIKSISEARNISMGSALHIALQDAISAR
jgi:hypothetical protein